MSRFWIILMVVAVSCPALSGRELWTLEDCIAWAVENNIQINRDRLQSEIARNNYSQSMLRILPGLAAFANHDLNSGRALNYDTYQWENREFEQGNMGLEARLNVLGGFHNYNNIRHHRFLLLSKLEDVERQMNDVSLQISAAFFQILMDMELLDIAEKLFETSVLELEVAKSNYRVGNISRGRLLEMESQLAEAEYQKIRAENNLSRSYLDLRHIMQLDPDDHLEICAEGVHGGDESVILKTVENIYSEAENTLPQIRGAGYFLKSRESELAMIRGQMSPRLSLRGLFYTRYSELAVNPVDGGDYSYSSQLRDNQYRQLGLSLIVPIFDGWTVRNRIGNSKISVLDAGYHLDAARQDLYSEIHLIHNGAVDAYKRYKYSGKAALAAEESFEFSAEQFRLGLISYVDYQYARSVWLNAESNRTQAKYEFYLRSRILNFYLGDSFLNN